MSLYDRMKEPFVSFAHGFAATDEERLRSLREAWEDACARATAAEAQAAELQERVRVLTEALRNIFAKLDDGRRDAPGHCHDVAAMWDADNPPDRAGKPCDWCAQWSLARTALHDTGQSVGAGRRFTPADVEVAARAIAVQACGGRDDWTKWQAFDRECYFEAARAALRSVGTLEEDEDHG